MASPGALIKAVADVLGLPEATVFNYDRPLAVAGLRSRGGRGPSAATVTARDAAHLLTAVLASGQAKDAADTITRYATTRPHGPSSTPTGYGKSGIAELSRLPALHSFVDALEALIVSVAGGTLAEALSRDAKKHKTDRHAVAPLIDIAALSPGTVGDIRLAGLPGGLTVTMRYAPPIESKRGTGKPPRSDLEQYRRISARTIITVATLIGVSEEDRSWT